MYIHHYTLVFKPAFCWSNVHFEFQMPFLINIINTLVEVSPTPLVAKPETIAITRQRLVNFKIQNKNYLIAFLFLRPTSQDNQLPHNLACWDFN